MIKKIVFIFIFWRLFLFLPLFFGKDISYRPGYEYTNIFTSTGKYAPVDSPLLNPWANFDGVHYLDIAGNGYKDNGGFFPFYPILIRGISTIFGTGQAFGLQQFFSALLISSVSFLIALIFLYKLIVLDHKKNIAFWAVIFLMFFPTSFFFVTAYTESLFFLLTVLAFYFIRKKQWLFASVGGMFLSVTRLTGIFIIPSLTYEYIKENKKTKNSIFHLPAMLRIALQAGIPYSIFIVPAGLLAFSYYCYLKWQNPLFYIYAQTLFKNGRTAGFVFPLQTAYRYIKILLTVSPAIFEYWIALLEFACFWLAGYLLFIAWRKKVRFSYLLFSIFCFLAPICSGTFSGLPRYILVLFPMFIGLSLQMTNKYLKILYIFVGLALQFILLMLFSRGYYIA